MEKFKKVTTKFKRFTIEQVAENTFNVYTPDEMEQPAGFRYPEWEAGTLQEAKDFIKSY